MTYSGGNFSCHRHLSDIVYHVLMTWINGVLRGDPHNVLHGALRDVHRWSVDNSCDALGTYVGKSRRNSSQSEALRGPSQSQFLRLFLRTWLVKKVRMYVPYVCLTKYNVIMIVLHFLCRLTKATWLKQKILNTYIDILKQTSQLETTSKWMRSETERGSQFFWEVAFVST